MQQFIDILGEHGYDQQGLLSDYKTTLGLLEQETKCVAKTTGKKKSELINMCEERKIVYNVKDSVAKLKELLATPFNFQEKLVSMIYTREQILSLKRLNELYIQSVRNPAECDNGRPESSSSPSLFEYSMQDLRALCKEKRIKPVGRTKHDLVNAILYGIPASKSADIISARRTWIPRSVFQVEPLLDGGYVLDLHGHKFKLDKDKYAVSNFDGSELEVRHLDLLLSHRIKYICPTNIKM